MNIVPLEKAHFSQIDLSATNHIHRKVVDIGYHRVLYGKTAIQDGRVVGIGSVTLYGKIAVASLTITDHVKKYPILLIKSIHTVIKEVYNEGYMILAAAHSPVDRRFLERLGFMETQPYLLNSHQMMRYAYGRRGT